MAFISLQNISLSFGEHPLLNEINLQIEKNQRICLLGRNGTGKSSLLKIIAGIIEQDAGEIITDQKIRVSYLSQEIPDKLDGFVFDVIADSLGEHAGEIKQYFREETGINDEIKGLNTEYIHTPQNFQDMQRIRRTAGDLNIQPEQKYNDLSGGQKRRTLLAAALITRPDLLLLDEPTNHIDVSTIVWLEEYILKFHPTILFITHDRSFLKRLATRIIELDRGDLFDYHCSYDEFLKRKKAYIETQEKNWANFDRKLSEEEAWLRKGVRARRTRNEGRVRALLKMREQKRERRRHQGTAAIEIGQQQKSGKNVIVAEDISFAYNENMLIKNFSAVISRGDKIGIIGVNGCGKTTLIKLLLGDLQPVTGSIKSGTNLSIAYFDQMRNQIDPGKSIQENVQPNGDTVIINNRPKHIISYLQDFLFTAERVRSPVSQLSGGEINRLLLAKLFTQPCNLLVMDEPTNDLDAETLELLEDMIVEFNGTVIIISHDRTFLDNTTGSLYVFKENGQLVEITGGYEDWLIFKEAQQNGIKEKKNQPKENKQKKKKRPKTKLSFKEQRELDSLPAVIEKLELNVEKIHREMVDPEVYKNPDIIKKLQFSLSECEDKLNSSYSRWESLEKEKNRLEENA
jgi:ABC transport system ATP-binding/permease protein